MTPRKKRVARPTNGKVISTNLALEHITQHINKYLGQVNLVFHEATMEPVHVDIHVVGPTGKFPFVRLITSGMSDLAMTVPDDISGHRYAELMITLPGDWQLDTRSFKNEIWYWPIRLLRGLALFTHQYKTWLGYGHSFENENPPISYATNTELCGALIITPISVPKEFHILRSGLKEIAFFAVIPLYAEEMILKQTLGLEELLKRFDNENIIDIVNTRRKNVAEGYRL